MGLLAPASACTDSTIKLLPELGAGGGADGTQTCADDGDCADRCNLATHECVDCLSDADCGERLCNLTTHECIECFSDANCGGDEPDKCLVEEGECVQCLANGDCELDEPYCDPDGNRCEECLLDVHCTAGEICDSDEERCVAPPM